LGEKVAASAFTVAISQFGRSQLCRWSSYEHWQKLQVVHCGLDAAFLETPAVPPPAAPRLVCVARLEEANGTPLLIEAASKLAQQGLDFTLTIIGDGRMRGQIEAMIERLGLQDVVHLVGWKNNAEVRQELLASRALVLPSFAEGLPVAIMEALALRRPVISTYVGGIAELIQPGKSGWLISPGSLEPLVSAMYEALTASRESLAAMGAAGAQAVNRQHNANIEAARLKELFQRSAPLPLANTASSDHASSLDHSSLTPRIITTPLETVSTIS
jgi:colanic acid/amylovoran biosynthesis glycosyltransferase